MERTREERESTRARVMIKPTLNVVRCRRHRASLFATAAIQQLLQMGVRAEQQALAKWGLNYVIEEYLPNKLAETSKFLP